VDGRDLLGRDEIAVAKGKYGGFNSGSFRLIQPREKKERVLPWPVSNSHQKSIGAMTHGMRRGALGGKRVLPCYNLGPPEDPRECENEGKALNERTEGVPPWRIPRGPKGEKGFDNYWNRPNQKSWATKGPGELFENAE